MHPTSATGFSRVAIEACVERIAASRHFSRSARLCRFLRFTIEATLDGRAEELKERTIAVAVYGRAPTYDSGKDAIVRSEAHRLRARLAAYYAREGSADSIVIDYPKGCYVPVLHPNGADRAVATGTMGRRPARPAATRSYDPYLNARHETIQYGNTLDPRHFEPARRRLETALAHAPEDVDALAERAHLELLRLYPPRGDLVRILADARALLERALALEPRHARALYLLGHVEGGALRPREALRLTETALAIDPDDPEGWTMLAVRYTSLGFWESAVVACDRSAALDPVWEAPQRIRVYLITRMGRFAAARAAVDRLARGCTSPTEVAIARFDLRLAEGDLAGAQAALASPESTFSVRPDQEDRREIAQGLVDALAGRRREARATLDARRGDGPRFWDHGIRLALAVGEDAVALELFQESAINRSYRWLANEPLARPYLHRPRWRALAEDLHRSWLEDLEELGPRLPASPVALPAPQELCGVAKPRRRARPTASP